MTDDNVAMRGPALEDFVFVGDCFYAGARKKNQGAKIRRGDVVAMSEADYQRNIYYFEGMMPAVETSDGAVEITLDDETQTDTDE